MFVRISQTLKGSLVSMLVYLPPYLRLNSALAIITTTVYVIKRFTYLVMGHRSNTLDNQCGDTIINGSASGASLPLCKRAEEGKQLEIV